MKVLLFGATGMVGAGALIECLADPRVESVVSISRSPTGRSHPKLREVIQPKSFSYNDLRLTSHPVTHASSASELRPWG